MIISKTPLRMSFVGGGSDLPVFYRKYGGAVVSTAINKFVYVTVNQKFDDRIRLSYSKPEDANSAEKIKPPLVREALQMLGLRGGVEITSIADIPAKGTGLGSSSSFTVGLLNALHAFANRYASAEQLAEESCRIEIERCGEPIGKQDQYAAAFGGFTLIEFNPDEFGGAVARFQAHRVQSRSVGQRRPDHLKAGTHADDGSDADGLVGIELDEIE